MNVLGGSPSPVLLEANALQSASSVGLQLDVAALACEEPLSKRDVMYRDAKRACGQGDLPH